MDDDEFAVEPLGPAMRSARVHPGIAIARRLATRNKLLRAGVVVALVAVVTAILVAQLPQGLGAAILPPDSPAATLDLTHVFTWSHGVPWGVLRIDGGARDVHTTAPASATLGISTEPEPIVLAPGRHTLEYVAPPFPPRTCVVDVPSRGADTCAETTEGDSGVRQLDLEATPAALPSGAYSALQTAVQRAFDASQTTFTLDPGVRFLGPGGHIDASDEQLGVQPRYVLDTSPSSANRGPSSRCLSLCDSGDNAGYDPTWWTVQASVRVLLDYLTATGEPLYLGVPAAADPTEADIPLPLNVAWTSAGWHVRTPTPWPAMTSPFCQIATQMRTQIHSDAALVPAVIAIEWANAADLSLLRCLLAGDEGEPLRPASAKARPVLLLYQFGLLLAASPAAQQIFPQLPVANAAEQQLADQFRPTAP